MPKFLEKLNKRPNLNKKFARGVLNCAHEVNMVSLDVESDAVENTHIFLVVHCL